MKWLHRTIATSQAYQRSSQANASNRSDTRNYARFYLRQLSAELVLDSLDHAAGSSEGFPPELRLRAGARVMDLAGGVPVDQYDKDKEKAMALGYALQIFGRPLRSPDVQCDCERADAPSVVQTLYLVNHPVVRQKLASPEGRPAQIVKDHADDARRVEEAFLWVLGRMPAGEERDKCIQYVRGSASAQKGMEGLFRILLLSDEFILNH